MPLDPETGAKPVVDRLSAAKQALLSQWRRGRAVPAADGVVPVRVRADRAEPAFLRI